MTEKAVIKSVRYSLGQNYCFLFCLEIVKYDCTNIQRMSEPNLISDYFLSWLTFQQQINNDNDEEIQNHIERIGELPVKDFNEFCHGAKMKSLLTHNFLKWSHIWYHSFDVKKQATKLYTILNYLDILQFLGIYFLLALRIAI